MVYHLICGPRNNKRNGRLPWLIYEQKFRHLLQQTGMRQKSALHIDHRALTKHFSVAKNGWMI